MGQILADEPRTAQSGVADHSGNRGDLHRRGCTDEPSGRHRAAKRTGPCDGFYVAAGVVVERDVDVPTQGCGCCGRCSRRNCVG